MEPAERPALGSLALEFLHTLRRTRRGTVVDLVGTPEALLGWLVAHGSERRGATPLPPPDARLLVQEAHHLRRDVELLVATYARSGSVNAEAAFGINRILRACPRVRQLVTEADRPVLVERTATAEPVAMLGGIAEAAARLVTTVERARIRPCASPSCGTWFVDTSKGGRRKWCSMAGCGNRQKASVHRSKQRSA
jgi:predicted RNA-binding Zn ribbon-like protein